MATHIMHIGMGLDHLPELVAVFADRLHLRNGRALLKSWLVHVTSAHQTEGLQCFAYIHAKPDVNMLLRRFTNAS